MSLETQEIRDEINIRLEQLKESLADPKMDERETTITRGEILGLQSVLLILDRDVSHEVPGPEEGVAMPPTDDTEPIAEETDEEQAGDPEVDDSRNSIDDEESSDDTPTPSPETDDTAEEGASAEPSEEPDTPADR